MRALILLCIMFFAMFVSAADNTTKATLACSKDRTVSEYLQAAIKEPNQKGTVGLVVASNLDSGKPSVRTHYVAAVTYKQAAAIGQKTDGFFWVPDSASKYEEIQAGKSKVPLMSCCSSANGCSRCCQSGGCICWDFDNGGCSCSGC